MKFDLGATLRKFVLALLLLMLPAAIAGAQEPGAWAPTGPPSAEARPSSPEEYRIGPLDKLKITVFQVSELSLDQVQVDASGQILLPLIGTVVAKDKTTRQLSTELAARLEERYLQNPQVSVLVEESASQKVTVEGAVMQAGVYDLNGRTTLLQAIAMARGPAKNADLKRVAIFRDIEGRRMAAVFDLRQIRTGRSEDPEILGNDVVVVAGSGMKGALREVISVLPALGVFAVF